MGTFLLLNCIPIPRISHQLDCAEICQQAEPTSIGIGFPSSLIKYYTADMSESSNTQQQLHTGDIRNYPIAIPFNLLYFLLLSPYIAIILNSQDKLGDQLQEKTLKNS